MGLDDPQWGKNKGGSNPPDLDEVLRNVNKKLSSFFGQRKIIIKTMIQILVIQNPGIMVAEVFC